MQRGGKIKKKPGSPSPRHFFLLLFFVFFIFINSMQDTVTAVDIVDAQQQLEKEAHESLPGKFEKCTFHLGYVRQALFACKTCSTPDNKEPAGMCYSCSMACHPNHDLLELFPKRHFRCDCGIPGKFGDFPCNLNGHDKQHVTNDENIYNHNFSGRYCRCNEIYDPANESDVMYQCILCEDWFHERCIGKIPEKIANFESYVCRSCTTKHPVLLQHSATSNLAIALPGQPLHRWMKPKTTGNPSNHNQPTEDAGPSTEPSSQNTQAKRSWDEAFDSCRQVTRDWQDEEQVELFLQDGWRENLCHCSACSAMYREHKIEYVLQEEHTVEPEDDEDAGKSLLDIGMEQLVKMDRVKALDSIRLYQTFADQFKTYLKQFQVSGKKVVTEQDIRQFFAERERELDHRHQETK
ncbi:hypothetical protein DM01DRAFT_1337948 [Hesseltinella vesiculosa]|uniref:UBR-type domain-containing protein n=1 Tax=Hesseltinella vesiculosa TaxID=101127 RepID=A0A1X2GBA1_9FUNG|nr:hypothetical protein DM01DRAFT_1337948 [Hesseltinella vesiculosa]